ncbi:MAG: serine/threonine protein kinase [Polyangiales bacterium]
MEQGNTPAVVLGGRYELLYELGQGGFGTTHAALDRETQRKVAVKILDLHRVEEWKSVELFEREAEVLRTLDHPGIPAYVEFRPLEADKTAYLVQALAPGKDLLRVLQERRFDEDALLDLSERVPAYRSSWRKSSMRICAAES